MSLLVGNFFTHYDTALFSLLSPLLAPLFFPEQEPLTALILTYGMIPLGMIAKPLGSLFFGWFGDRYGRSPALIIAMMGMGWVSICMAMMPTFQEIGYWAAIVLASGRFLQNLFASGETVGGAILLLENEPERKHQSMSVLYNTSTIAGILFASILVYLFWDLKHAYLNWRWLYGLGCLTALSALALRWNSSEPFQKRQKTQVFFSGELIWKYREPFCLVAIASGFSYSTYSISLVLMNGLAPYISAVPQKETLGLNCLLLAADMAALPFFGFLFRRMAPAKVMMLAALFTTVTAMPLFFFLERASWETFVCVRVILVMLGCWFSAPFYAWAQKQVPPMHRYLILSLAYTVGTQLFGATATPLTLWLLKSTGSLLGGSLYWMALSLVTGIAMARSIGRKEVDLISQS